MTQHLSKEQDKAMKLLENIYCHGSTDQQCPLPFARIAHAAASEVPGVASVRGFRPGPQPVDVDLCGCRLHIEILFGLEEDALGDRDVRSIAEEIGRAVAEAVGAKTDFRPTSFYLYCSDPDWEAHHDGQGRFVELVELGALGPIAELAAEGKATSASDN